MKKGIVIGFLLAVFLAGSVCGGEPSAVKIGNGELLIKGYIQVRYSYLSGIGNTDVFAVKSAYLDFSGKINPKFSYELAVDSALTDGKILKWVYLKYNLCPYAIITAGQFASPLTYEYWLSVSLIDTAERAKCITSLGGSFDIGLLIEGQVLNNMLSYTAGIVNGSGANVADNNENKDFIARLTINPLKDLSIGLGYMNGVQPASGSDDGIRNRCSALVKYDFCKVRIQGEFISQAMQQSSAAYKISNGYYAQAVCGIWPLLQPVLKYEEYDPDLGTNNNREGVATFGLNWFPYDCLKVMADYRVKTEETPVDNNEFLLQAQVKF